VEVDRRSESLGKRIAEAHERGVPYAMVLGARELASGNVALRFRDRPCVLGRAEAIAEVVAAARPPAFEG
jgi:threonyl-tRNA synthetase